MTSQAYFPIHLLVKAEENGRWARMHERGHGLDGALLQVLEAPCCFNLHLCSAFGASGSIVSFRTAGTLQGHTSMWPSGSPCKWGRDRHRLTRYTAGSPSILILSFIKERYVLRDCSSWHFGVEIQRVWRCRSFGSFADLPQDLYDERDIRR